MTTDRSRQRGVPRLVWGALLVIVGVALLVDPYVDVVQISVSRLWPLIWPLLIMFLGLKMIWPSFNERRGLDADREPRHAD